MTVPASGLPARSSFHLGEDEGKQRSAEVQILEIRVAELEEQNAAMLRQLNARPIVFQFAPEPEEEDDDARPARQDDVDEEDLAPERLAATGPLKQANARPPGADAAAPAPAAAAVLGALVQCSKRSKRCFAALRKQRQAKNLERMLRHFTKSMLKSPALLWFWYAHVLVLWFLEVWRQAVSTQALDPTERINQRMAAHAAVPR